MANCLELNVVKTKELVIDFRSSPHPCQHQSQHIDIVHTYLGTTIDDKLRWDDSIMNLYKKCQQRLYFLRNLNVLHIDRMFFICVPRFICKKCYDVRSCLLVGKSLSQKQRKTKQNINISCKFTMCCTPDTSLEQLYKSRTLQMATKILSDPHPLLTRPLRPSPLWKEVQNANSKNPASL